ncbi:hypothetical protein HLV39_14130 [Marinobacter adhaerens]|uniref:Secreted protein n=1 Tax=Marinobacter adhaerens TaxID=1033846 RepID=A0A851I3D1_9GAMM|nr:hypothetical protein [Marinobacter adhaerens]NWN92631.1 hypothetical protein [Marinobacter adhaerens]
MLQRNKFLMHAIVTTLILMNVTLVAAQPTIGNNKNYVRDSAEGVNLRLQVNDQLSVVAVRITQCEGCQPTTFLPAKNISIEHGEDAVKVERGLELNGQPGVILYHPETELAEIVVFYGQ